MENHQQTEEIEEAEGNEEINEKENEDNDQILNNTIIESLVTRTKKLQEENAQLKQDIENISTSNKGNALQYFTNIRKEIFTKIDTLNKQIQDFNKNKIIENKKQKRDMEYINGQLNEATELNKNLKAQLENLTNEIEQNDNIIKQEENVELKNLPNNDQVEDLDEKINSLTAEITKNEYLIKDQTETINELQETYETQTKELNEQYEDIKNKYHNLLGSAEIIEDQLDKDFSEKTKEFQKNMENNIYALTKKLLYSNNNLSQKNLEKENLKQQCIGQIEQKNSEITDLKNQIKEYQTKYELLYKLSIDQLNKFGNNYAKFKTTFFNREKDCINVYNYYKDMMEQYNKPLLDEENPNNKLEKDYHEKASAVINLQQENEKLLSDLENIKQKKYKESKEIRSEINTNVDKNDRKINDLIKKEKDLSTKIKKFSGLYNDLIQRNANIEKLSKENKHILNENKLMENKIFNYFNNIGGDDDISGIKLKIKKLEEEAAYKDEVLSNYEEMFKGDLSEMEEQDEVRDDVIKRLKTQIEGLKGQIDKLNQTKSNMDNYYKNQISELKNQMKSIIFENNNLRDTNQIIHNGIISQNQKTVDSWQKVYKDMKNQFNSQNDIQSLITAFNHTNNALLKIKEFNDEKELKKLREEANEKEKQINDLKEIKYDAENKLRQNIQNMTQTIQEKLKIYNELNEKKNQILKEFDKNVEEFNKINENKLNYSNNELNGIEENKKKLVELSQNMEEQKLKEIQEIKIQIKDLENQIKEENEKYLNDVKDIKNNNDEQLKIIKDREDYITKQTDIAFNNLKSVANQNEKAVEALRQENQQLKNQNYTLSKRLS
jgi:cell division initiation protein